MTSTCAAVMSPWSEPAYRQEGDAARGPAHRASSLRLRQSAPGHQPRRGVGGAVGLPVARCIEVGRGLGDESVEAGELAVEDLHRLCVGARRRICFLQSIDCLCEDVDIHRNSEAFGCDRTSTSSHVDRPVSQPVARIVSSSTVRPRLRRSSWLCVHFASERCSPRSAATLTRSSSARRSSSRCPGARRGDPDGRRSTSRAPTVEHPPEESITTGVMSRSALSAVARRSAAAAMRSGSGIITQRGDDVGFAPCIRRCDHELNRRRSPRGLRATQPRPIASCGS